MLHLASKKARVEARFCFVVSRCVQSRTFIITRITVAFWRKNKVMKNSLFLLVAMLFLVIGTPASAQHCDTQKGDSMWKIARRYKIPFREILELNKHYPNPHLIHPQDKIELPDGEHGTSSEEANSSKGMEIAEQAASTTQADQVLELVNKERAKVGLKALTLSDELTNVATLKAKDMAEKGYFDHTSPTYGTPFEMMKRFGIQYRSAGENIAAGQMDAQEVMDSWMNSSGHRANILNSDYEQIGIGYYTGGRYDFYWVQMFKK